MFKIIGIRALPGCAKRILKNLEENKFYPFYSNYDMEGDFVVEKECSSVPKDFFAPNISIHALVGVNGSGKSTIVELMIRIINNLYFPYQPSKTTVSFAKILYVKNLNAELYFCYNNNIFKIHAIDDQITLTDKEGTDYIDSAKDFQQYFFYTIITNYSHYAYNSRELHGEAKGESKGWTWIDALFHKNDGYTTPIVLNPFRENGNIDINTETSLAIQRLITFFTYFKLNKERFHPNYEIYSYELKLDKIGLKQKYDKAKTKYFPITKSIARCDFDQAANYIKQAWEVVLFENINSDIEYTKYCWDYIVYKTISIISKYPFYTEYFSKHASLPNPFEKIIMKIYNDESHISIKLIQTINFMINPQFKEGKYKWDEIDKIMRNSKVPEAPILQELMESLPPPIFRTQFYLSYKTSNNRLAKINIKSMSSGERQMLYSISSTLYHLHNLDSIRDNERIQYSMVQLIFEEIELYYHPEYQREYISTIINYIKKLRLSSIMSIDILIVTHSPFVVSDIPKENILFLQEGCPYRPPQELNNTFGANFYDLLKNNFFLQDCAYGEFANSKIGNIVNKIRNNNELSETEQKTVCLIGDTFLKNIIEDNILLI